MAEQSPKKSLRRWSPSVVVALAVTALALIVAATSTATAAYMIGSNQIKKNAVKTKHIKKNAVKAKQIKKNAVKPRHLSPAAREGMTGPEGPQGEPGMSDYSIESRVQTIAGNASGAAFTVPVTCPSGTVPLGGGYAVDPGAELQILISRPNPNGNSWTTYGKNYGADGVELTVYATCAAIAE